MLVSSLTTCSKSNDCNQTYSQRQRLLDEQLDWLTVDHDDLKQDLLERISAPKYHPSMSVIDKWEEQTIARIRHAAFLARRALIDALDRRVFEVKETLSTLTPKLRDARNHIKSFNENDIQEWSTMLQELKQIPVFPVTVDKENSIPGLTIDLTKEEQTYQSESTSRNLISILRNPITSTSTPSTTEFQLSPTNLPKKTDIDKKKVNFDNVSSNGSYTVTPESVIIIREQPKNETTTTITARHVRQAHAEIPFDSRTNYPLRGPPNFYH
jgi:hypothetical protein